MDIQEKAMAELAATIGTIGWKRVIVPTLKAEILQTADQLAQLKRPNEVPDDFLRGRVEGLKFTVTVFEQQLAEFYKNKADQQVPEPEPVGSPYDPAANRQEG